MSKTDRYQKQHQVKTSWGVIDLILKCSKARRSLSIIVDNQGQVSMAAPFSVSLERIEYFIQQKAEWIFKKRAQAKNNEQLLKQRVFDHGHEFLFLGQRYPLYLVEINGRKHPHIQFSGNAWQVGIPFSLMEQEAQRREIIAKKMKEWYREQAQEILGTRLFSYAPKVGAAPREIAIRTQKRMWGNCHFKSGKIHLNWQIVLAPLEVIDYVIVHELCHLIVPNHSKRFWQKVAQVLPNFKEQKRWLKDNWVEMVLPG